MKLKRTEIKEYRLNQLTAQSYRCALCDEVLNPIEAVLDHDHKTGLIRQVLHRGCNAMLGKIENNMARNRMSPERLAKWAVNIVQYITKTHCDLIHPTHLTKEERAMKKRKGGGRGKGRGR